VRRNIASLAPDGPEIASLRRGVAAMQQVSQDDPTDPRGWRFQANIHGAPADEPFDHPAWRQCQHGSFFFLPWHRMYLYWFERILRKAANDPALTLPYWDYSLPEDEVLPAPFRDPADAANPLYLDDRDPAINAGAPPWSVLQPLFDHARAFTYTNFSHTDPLDASFGGGWSATPIHGGAAPQSTGQLEGTPHAQVHIMIGGRLRYPDGTIHSAPMGDPRFAARDPIFWLHHANIDRLWKRWLDQGGGRMNPIDDEVWMGTAFTFFDEDGHRVEMTAREVLFTEVQLGYRYDDDPAFGGGPGQRGPGAEPAGSGGPPGPDLGRPSGGGPVAPAPPRPRTRSVLGESRAGQIIALGADPVTIPIRRDAQQTPSAESGSETGDRVVLTIEGLRGTGVPGVSFELYLHSAQLRNSPPPSASFAGLLSLFGLQPDDMAGHGGAPSATQSFDVSEIVQAALADPSQRGRLAVTFVPRLLASGPTPPGPWATAERVALSVG
jgi:tyrosinase